VDDVDRQRLSAIAHATSAMWSPISGATLATLVARVIELGFDDRSRLLDLGCGPAELLRRVVAVTGARGVGIDSSPFALAEARRRLEGRREAERIELRLGDVTEERPTSAFDLVVCIGPGWDHGGWSRLVTWASGFAAPGGWLLLAEGAWRTRPSAEDLATLGLSLGDYPMTAEVAAAVRRAGTAPIWQHVVDAAAWDAYGAAYRSAMVSHLAERPGDPLARALRERAGEGWGRYDLLHRLLDFVILLVPAR
jgi:SAM-dependent methyltransferase